MTLSLPDAPLGHDSARSRPGRHVGGGAAKIPVRRVGLTSEIAEGHSYLMKRTHATGQVLVVGGGASKMIGGAGRRTGNDRRVAQGD